MVLVILGRAMKELQYGGAFVGQFGAGADFSTDRRAATATRRKRSDVES